MSTARAVLSVSELTRRLQETLEERFPAVWVEGEISNFRLYGSGHAYFTLKDAESQIRAVLFRNRGRRIRFEPADGLHVMAFGSIEVYPQRGEYQLVIELLEPKGLGALQLAFEQLKARLQAEGLFDQARKRELPRFPRKIGIVTSTGGAAIRDMLRVIGRRFGELHIVIAPCRVQGDGAAEEIAQGIRDLDALGGVDVIIVGRATGSSLKAQRSSSEPPPRRCRWCRRWGTRSTSRSRTSWPICGRRRPRRRPSWSCARSRRWWTASSSCARGSSARPHGRCAISSGAWTS